MKSETRVFCYGMIGVPVLLAIVLFSCYGHETGNVLALLQLRSGLLLVGSADFSSPDGGFLLNIIITLVAMGISLVTGTLLCSGMISTAWPQRTLCRIVMNVLRNTPWLVALYAMLYLLPFHFQVFGISVSLSPFVKAVIGLSLPVTANVAEVMRGGIEAIHGGQWESAQALGYRRHQILRYVVIPQAIPIILPNMMTVFAMLFIGSSLAVVTGTNDVLSVANTITGSDGAKYATAIQLYVLLLFFVFNFPIAIFSRRLERQMREKS